MADEMAPKKTAREVVDQWFRKHFDPSAGSFGDAYTAVREKLPDLVKEMEKEFGAFGGQAVGRRSVSMEVKGQ